MKSIKNIFNIKKYHLILKDLLTLGIVISVTLLFSFIINKGFIFSEIFKCFLIGSTYIYVSCLIVLIASRNIPVNNFYKIISIGFTTVGIVKMLLSQSISAPFTLQDMGILMQFNFVILIGEILILIIAFYNNEDNFSISYAITYSLLSLICVTIIIFRTNLGNIFTNILLNHSVGLIVLKFIYISLYIFLLKLCNKRRFLLSEIGRKYLRNYILLLLLLQVAQLIAGNNPLIHIKLTFILFIFASYCMFKFMILDIIKKTTRDLSNTIEEKNEIIKAKDLDEQLKNELLANISHEFKTPVNVIYSAIQTQDLCLSSNDYNSAFKYNGVIKQNCFRLTKLINNFIDLTRFEAGNFQINLECRNIVELVEDVTLSVVEYAKCKEINIVFDTNEEELYAMIDPQLIDRVMLNLLSNAIKYNKNKGFIRVYITCTDETISIDVCDSGIGIPKDKQHLVFSRFERVDKSLYRKAEGSGLGLHIVKNIVNSLNGTISFQSTVFIGTTFTMKLPRLSKPDITIINNIDSSSILKERVEVELSDIYM